MRITIFKNKKRGSTKYSVLLWRDQSGICFKYGKSYGFDSCWENIFPKIRPYYYIIPFFKLF